MAYEEIFKEATIALKSVNRLLEQETFISSCENVLRDRGVTFHVSDRKPIVIPHEGSGIYMFWADLSRWVQDESRSWDQILTEFLDRWDHPTESVRYFPRSNRGNAMKSLGEYKQGGWIPFYLGKSEKVAQRVGQHLYLEPEKRTYALKLKSRVALLMNVKFEINWIPFTTTKENYYLIERVESLLREKFGPIIGKQ